MGLLDKLNSGPTKNAQSLLGQIPATVPGASPSSQTHSQGAFDMEGQGAVNDRGESIGSLSSTTGNGANRPASATNLNFKKSTGHSVLDLDGGLPGIRAGALPTSQLHAQGTNTEASNPSTAGNGNQRPTSATNLNFKTQVGQSQYDLDGQLPSTGTYRDNSPEDAAF